MMLGVQRERLAAMELLGLIPSPIYGHHLGSPLWSLRQVSLVAGIVKWFTLHQQEPSKYARDMLTRQVGKVKKEWDDGYHERNDDGNHRNARWRYRRVFGVRRYGNGGEPEPSSG
jgi:hypothetical protein